MLDSIRFPRDNQRWEGEGKTRLKVLRGKIGSLEEGKVKWPERSQSRRRKTKYRMERKGLQRKEKNGSEAVRRNVNLSSELWLMLIGVALLVRRCFECCRTVLRNTKNAPSGGLRNVSEERNPFSAEKYFWKTRNVFGKCLPSGCSSVVS